MFHTDIKSSYKNCKKVFSTQLNLNINLSVFLFNKQLGTSEPVKDWQALTSLL